MSHHEVNSELAAGLVLAWLPPDKIAKLEEPEGNSFVIRTKYTGLARYRITVDRIPDDEQLEPGVAATPAT
jgi:hypothetical protein